MATRAFINPENATATALGLQKAEEQGDMEDCDSASEGDEEMTALIQLNQLHADDLTPAQLQERQKRQAWVLQAVREASSMEEVLKIAGIYVEPEWLFAVEEISGDLYRVAAFGGIPWSKVAWHYRSGARLLGCISIWVIQVVGPFALVWENRAAIVGFGGGGMEATRSVDSNATGFLHWSAEAWSELDLAKFVGVAFLFLYLLQNLFSVSSELEGWNRTVELMNRIGEKRGRAKCLLYLGAFTHLWAAFWSCAAAFIVIGEADDVKDVLFDALGLTFLVELDNITGGMNFIEEVPWPSKGLGWLANNLEYFSEQRDHQGSHSISFAFQLVRLILFFATGIAPIALAFTRFQTDES